MRKLTTEQFIKKARGVHGDLYDYSRVEYTGTNSKVTIICPKHGAFEQRASKHISDCSGCKKCGAERSGKATAKRNTKYHYEGIKDSASKYKTRTGFAKGNPGAYKAACTRDILDEICSHMEKHISHINSPESVELEASKYSSRIEFKKGNLGAYTYARKNGLLNTICNHMNYLQNPSYSVEDIMESAKSYDCIQDWRDDCGGMYSSAHRNDILNEVTEHMTRKHGDYDAIYIWEAVGIFSLTGDKVYKIGVTSWRLGVQRINQVSMKSGIKAKIVMLRETKDSSLIVETMMHELGEDAGFEGFDGCTEFRILTEEELELAIDLAKMA